jgi:hypothetical protein
MLVRYRASAPNRCNAKNLMEKTQPETRSNHISRLTPKAVLSVNAVFAGMWFLVAAVPRLDMESQQDTQIRSLTSVVSTGAGSFALAPDVMTEQEAIHFLRLDEDGTAHPEKTLRYYREKKLLTAIRIGKHLRYSRFDLLEFLRKVRV